VASNRGVRGKRVPSSQIFLPGKSRADGQGCGILTRDEAIQCATPGGFVRACPFGWTALMTRLDCRMSCARPPVSFPALPAGPIKMVFSFPAFLFGDGLGNGNNRPEQSCCRGWCLPTTAEASWPSCQTRHPDCCCAPAKPMPGSRACASCPLRAASPRCQPGAHSPLLSRDDSRPRIGWSGPRNQHGSWWTGVGG
jgi:hypothetical protein